MSSFEDRIDEIFAPIQEEYNGGEPMLPGTIPTAKKQLLTLMTDTFRECLPEKPYHIEGSGGSGGIETKSWKVYDEPASSIITLTQQNFDRIVGGKV